MAGEKAEFQFRTLEKESLGEKIASELRRMIASGELKPGSRIIEADISGSLGVSRAPVREAINILVSEQLLERQPYKGVSVYDPTPEDAAQMNEARLIIESYALHKIITSSDGDAIEKLRKIVDSMRNICLKEQADWQALAELDFSFHQTICAGAKNRFLTETWTGILMKLRIMFMQENSSSGRPKANLKEHEQLLSLIEAGDEDKLKELLASHFVNGDNTAVGLKY